MNLIRLYRSNTNGGILFRWTVNILAFCLFVLIAVKAGDFMSGGNTPPGHGGPDSSVIEH
jgi:hypothetical protein